MNEWDSVPSSYQNSKKAGWVPKGAMIWGHHIVLRTNQRSSQSLTGRKEERVDGELFVWQATRQPGRHSERTRLLGPQRGLLSRRQPLCLQVGPPNVHHHELLLSLFSEPNICLISSSSPSVTRSSSDKSVKVWDAASRTCINTFFDHQDQVTSSLLCLLIRLDECFINVQKKFVISKFEICDWLMLRMESTASPSYFVTQNFF